MRLTPRVSVFALLLCSISAVAAPPGFSRTCDDNFDGNRHCTIKAGNDLEFSLIINPDGTHTLMVAKQVEYQKAKYYLKGGNYTHDCYVIMNWDILRSKAVFVSPKDASFVEDWGDPKCDLSVPLDATQASPRLMKAHSAAIQAQQANAKKTEALVEKLEAKAANEKAECLRIGDENYCRCAMERMPLGGTFKKYLNFILNVAVDTRTVPEEQFANLPAGTKEVVDGYSRMRAECGASGTPSTRKPARPK